MTRICFSRLFALALTGLAFLSVPVPALAQQAAVPAVTAAPAPDSLAEYRPVLAQAETYLNSITTLKARFLLTAADGTQQIGTFYLNRPGRLRFEYDPPSKDFIVADGLMIYFYDSQLKQESNAPIGQTLADFLLRKKITLSGDVTIDRVMRGGGLLQVTLRQTKDPGAGSLTLGLTENPDHTMALKKWRVVDAQNQTVEVELFQVQTGMPMDPKLFIYRDPTGKKQFND